MPYVKVGEENSGHVKLHYEDYGDGEPIILIHGCADRSRSRSAGVLREGHAAGRPTGRAGWNGGYLSLTGRCLAGDAKEWGRRLDLRPLPDSGEDWWLGVDVWQPRWRPENGWNRQFFLSSLSTDCGGAQLVGYG